MNTDSTLFTKLYEYGEIRKYPAKHVLIWEDTVPEFCYIVLKGKVIGYELLPSGEKLVYSIQDQYDMFAETFVLTNSTLPVCFETETASELLCVDRGQLFAAMQSNPELMLALTNNISEKFNSAMYEVREMKSHNANWRLCQLLINLAERYGVPYDGKILIQEPFSLQTLANMMGVNRTTTIRSMKHLKDLGLIENINGYYCIRDLESLKNHQNYVK